MEAGRRGGLCDWEPVTPSGCTVRAAKNKAQAAKYAETKYANNIKPDGTRSEQGDNS